MNADRTTLLLSVSDIRSLLKTVGLRPFIAQLAGRIRQDFMRWPLFDKSPRSASYSSDGVIELMPTSDGARFGFKYVNGHPKNSEFGLPTVMAYGGLSEVATGWPSMITEMTMLTAIRTACTSAVAGKALARAHSDSMAMIGNGAQSEFQILAFLELMGIGRVNLFDVDPVATEKLVFNLSGIEGLELVRCGSVAEAVRGCSVVTTATATKAMVSVVSAEMVEPGMFVNAIGGDCPGKTEIDSKVLTQSKVFVEYEPQTRIEGELQQMPESFAVTELWQVLTDLLPGRTSDDDVTLFDSVGFSIEDFSTLSLVSELAAKHEIGREIELVPDLPDVRDVYGFLVAE